MAKKVAARTLDFSNVKESSGINPKHKPDADYAGRVLEVRDDPAKDGEAMWMFLIGIDVDKTASYPYYVKLVDNQLWKLRNLFLAAGVDIPKKAVKIDPNKVVGKQLGVVLEGEEYEGKMKSVISGLLPISELSDAGVDDEDDDDEEEVEPAPKKRGRPTKALAQEEDDDDEDEDDEQEEPAPKKRGRGRPRKVVEEDDDDDEDEEPAPKRGRGRPRKAAPAPVKKKRRRVEEDDDDDLDIDL